MVQIDIPAAFVASQFFIDLGRNAIQRQAAISPSQALATYYKFLFRSIFFAAFVIAPAGIYLLSGWPGWEQLYWTERAEQLIFEPSNALIPTGFVMAIVLAAYLGHTIGYSWVVNGKEKYLRPTYIGLLVAVGILVLLNYPAFLVVGSYQDYHHNREMMPKVWENPHGFSLAWFGVMAYFVISFLYLSIRITKEKRDDRG